MKNNIKTQVDYLYQQLLTHIITNGVDKGDRTGTGTRAVFGEFLKFDLRDGFPLLTTKDMSLKNISSELLWFMRGDIMLRPLLRDRNYIWVGDAYKAYCTKMTKVMNECEGSVSKLKEEYISSMLDTFNIDGDKLSLLSRKQFIELMLTDDGWHEMLGNLGPIYGKQWRDFYGVDQLQQCIDSLVHAPDSRRMLTTAWNPAEVPDAILPPCHIMFQFYSRLLSIDERSAIMKDETGIIPTYETHEYFDSQNIPKRELSLQWYQRSVDVPLGLPYNIASYAELTHIIAKMTNHSVGYLSCALGDTHVYLNQIEPVEVQLTRAPRKLPKLVIDKDIKWSTKLDEVLPQLSTSSFMLEGYDPHPTIKIPLSN